MIWKGTAEVQGNFVRNRIRMLLDLLEHEGVANG